MDEGWLNGMPRSKLDVSEETENKDVKSFETTEVKKTRFWTPFTYKILCEKKIK